MNFCLKKERWYYKYYLTSSFLFSCRTEKTQKHKYKTEKRRDLEGFLCWKADKINIIVVEFVFKERKMITILEVKKARKLLSFFLVYPNWSRRLAMCFKSIAYPCKISSFFMLLMKWSVRWTKPIYDISSSFSLVGVWT